MSAASAAPRKTQSRVPRAREVPGRRLAKRTAAGRGASLDLGPLDLVSLEAALAADLIAASISFHIPLQPNLFLDPAV